MKQSSVSQKASNGITRVHNTIQKYLFKIFDILYRIPMVMQIRHALRSLALNIMHRFKVGGWSKWVLRIVALLSEQIFMLRCGFV